MEDGTVLVDPQGNIQDLAGINGSAFANSINEAGQVSGAFIQGISDSGFIIGTYATPASIFDTFPFVLRPLGGDTSIGQSFCQSNPNSTGLPGVIEAFGSTSISADNVTLQASDVPNQAAIFIQGSQQAQMPLGNGFLCVGGGIVRLTSPAVTSGNEASFSLPTAGFTPGETAQFQFWFRDPNFGAGFSFTDGVEITFTN